MTSTRLKMLVKHHSMPLRKIENLTGIHNAHLSMMLTGRRPISVENWCKILMGLEQLSLTEARSRIASWQIEDANQHIPSVASQFEDDTIDGTQRGTMTTGAPLVFMQTDRYTNKRPALLQSITNAVHINKPTSTIIKTLTIENNNAEPRFLTLEVSRAMLPKGCPILDCSIVLIERVNAHKAWGLYCDSAHRLVISKTHDKGLLAIGVIRAQLSLLA